MANSPYKRPQTPPIKKHPNAVQKLVDGKLSGKSAPKRPQPSTSGLG
jgi:hypothetical protein